MKMTLRRPWALLLGSDCLCDHAGCDRSNPEVPTEEGVAETGAYGNERAMRMTSHGDRDHGPSGSVDDPIQPGDSCDDRSLHDHCCSYGYGCGGGGGAKGESCWTLLPGTRTSDRVLPGTSWVSWCQSTLMMPARQSESPWVTFRIDPGSREANIHLSASESDRWEQARVVKSWRQSATEICASEGGWWGWRRGFLRQPVALYYRYFRDVHGWMAPKVRLTSKTSFFFLPLFINPILCRRTERVYFQPLPDKCLEVGLVAFLMAGEGCAPSECLSAAWAIADIGSLASMGPSMTRQRRRLESMRWLGAHLRGGESKFELEDQSIACVWAQMCEFTVPPHLHVCTLSKACLLTSRGVRTTQPPVCPY